MDDELLEFVRSLFKKHLELCEIKDGSDSYFYVKSKPTKRVLVISDNLAEQINNILLEGDK